MSRAANEGATGSRFGHETRPPLWSADSHRSDRSTTRLTEGAVIGSGPALIAGKSYPVP